MFWDLCSKDIQSATTPDICVSFLHNTCSSGQKCTKIHTRYPFLWQSEIKGGWHSLPEFHLKEIEIAFRDVSSNSVYLTSVDLSTGKTYFDDFEQEWFVDFNKMSLNLTEPRISYKIRRLSTPSSSLVKDSMATNFVWYYMDVKSNDWIPFGQPDPGNWGPWLNYIFGSRHSSMKSTTSKRINFVYFTNFTKRINVFHAGRLCILDFEDMTIIDTVTKMSSPVRRRVEQKHLVMGKGNEADFTPEVGLELTKQAAVVKRTIRQVEEKAIFLNSGGPQQFEGFQLPGSFDLQSGTTAVKDEYEWYFKDERTNWIKYSSDDIDKQFLTNSNRYLVIGAQNDKCILDFIKMVQMNKKTRAVTPICRRLKSDASISERDIAEWTIKVVPEWYFCDQGNTWKKYTSTASSAIEQQFSQKPLIHFELSLDRGKYNIDFTNMMQTNLKTYVTKHICRRVKVVSLSCGSFFPPPTKILSIPRGNFSQPARTVLSARENSYTLSYPSHWLSMDASQAPWIKVPLYSSDLDYEELLAVIQAQTSFLIFSFRNIQRIQNPHLWNAYVNRKRYLANLYRETEFEEKFLFHGTDSANVNAICKENLDWRLHGSRHGDIYGQGVYFSNSFETSSQYSRSSTRMMFVFRVLIGDIDRGRPGIKRIKQDVYGRSFDTSVDSLTKPTIFVKYDSQEYYPEYVFEF